MGTEPMSTEPMSTEPMGAEPIGLAFSFIVAFVLGLVLGVLGCVAVIKFVQWMRGKSLFFNPWPRIRTDVPIHDPIMNNPTYELDNGRQHNGSVSAIVNSYPGEHSGSLIAVLEGGASSRGTCSGGGVEVYEAMEEPINEEEIDFEEHQFHPHPYAVHAYPDDELFKDTPKPVVFKKSSKMANNSGTGKKNDQAKSVSSGGGGGERAKKLAKLKPRLPSKPSTVKSPVHGAMLQLDSDPKGAYSELDKKMSYSTLEPHIGESTVVTKGDTMRGENYNLLNH